MKIVVNGKALETRPGVTLADILAGLNARAARVATMINGNVIPAERRAAAVLHEGDRVEVLAFAGGG